MEYEFCTLTSRAAALRGELEAAGWIYVSSRLATEQEAPENETITALLMTKN